MPRLILHAGMHKTGSSFLQNTLRSNREALLAAGVLYPEAGLHQDSPQAGYRHLGLRRSLDQEGPVSLAMSRLREEVAEHGCHTVIVSYEGFFTPETNTEDLRAALDDFDVTVLLFLRHPVDYIESKYREWVRLLHYSGEIEAFLSWQWPCLDVLALAAEWEAAFGRDQMIVRPHGQLRRPTDILEQLLALMPGVDLELQPDPSSNPGASNEYTLAKLLANRLKLAGTTVKPALVTAMTVDYGSNGGRLLSDDAIAEIERTAVPAFSSLLDRYGQSPHLDTQWDGKPQDAAFFDHGVRESVLRQLHSVYEQQAADDESRSRQRAEAKAADREAKRALNERLRRTQKQLDKTEQRLEAVQARLQRTTAERERLRRRLTLLKFWQVANWSEYGPIVRNRIRRTITRRRPRQRPNDPV